MEALYTPQVLETLKTARARIAEATKGYDPDGGVYFKFLSWNSCTCGHIYAAALGVKGMPAVPESEIYGCVDEGYLAALTVISRLDSRYSRYPDNAHLPGVVSELTGRRARELNAALALDSADAVLSDSRTSKFQVGALSLLDDAIAMTEAELEQARESIDAAIEVIEEEHERARELVAAGA